MDYRRSQIKYKMNEDTIPDVPILDKNMIKDNTKYDGIKTEIPNCGICVGNSKQKRSKAYNIQRLNICLFQIRYHPSPEK